MNPAAEKDVVVIAGPSGSGKNAVVSAILQRFKRCVRLVTATTRVMRPGEKDGADYHFFSLERFDTEMAAGKILERRFVAALNTHYGIYLPDLDEKIAAGYVVFATVDIEGAQVLKKQYNATTIFIMPESLEQFRGRLHARNPEWTQKEFDARMSITEEEMRVHAPQYDYRVVNADGMLAQTIDKVIEILQKEGYTLT
jgi:guanylate kinase